MILDYLSFLIMVEVNENLFWRRLVLFYVLYYFYKYIIWKIKINKMYKEISLNILEWYFKNVERKLLLF